MQRRDRFCDETTAKLFKILADVFSAHAK